MPAALPNALRVHFQEYIEEGSGGRAAAARLKLTPATGVRWLRRIRDTGTSEASVQGRPKGHGKLAPYQEFLEDLVAQDGDIILPELAGALEAATGVVAHSASIGRFPRKLGYTYKKVIGGHRTTACPCEAPAQGLVATPYASHAGAA